MLQLQNLSYTIAGLELLKEVQWIINPQKRVALIGPNGAGKTTLLRIIAGELEASAGTIIKPKAYRIGYLPQEEIALEKGTVLGTALEGHTEIMQIEEEMDNIHTQLENETGNRQLLERLGVLETHYHLLGGYDLEALAKKILVGLGFKQHDFHRPLSDLSGGWRMRAYLARLLIQQPDLLLLDEPTNHLDLESLEWIESYLKNFSGSMIIVSHDRFFIDRLAQEIAELKQGRLKHYPGNYRFYEQKKALEEEQLLKKWEEQREERQRIQRFIDRFRYKNTKAAQVQSRIKMLEKMEAIELPDPPRTIHFKIQADTVSFKEVLSIREMYFRYDADWVLQDLHLDVFRGEKIALVGVNGAGKTTLTRLISGELTPQKGTIRPGERVHVGYYAQHQIDSLNLEQTILAEIEATAARSFHPKLRDILGVFHFSGDDIQKPINVLSGGEKARVSLAKILLSPCNFLIMDEPTNHLDLSSKEALEQALLDYDGTLLLISHDRYFLDKLVTRVIELDQGRLREYAGNYSFYLEKRASRDDAETPVISSKNIKESDADSEGRYRKTKEQKQKEALARQAVSKERNQLQKRIADLEDEIDHLEKRKGMLEQRLADPDTYKDTPKAIKLKREYEEISVRLPDLEKQWEQCHLQMEAILQSLP